MKYSMIATALFGAAIAVPAMPAAYGEGENVYGTQVQAQQTTSAPAAAETTCTDEAEQAVPYTSAMSTPVAQAQTTEAAKQPESSAPSYGGAEGYGQQGSTPDMMTSSASEASPAGTTAAAEGSSMAAASSMPAGSAPAYSAPMNYGQGSEQETKAITETKVAQSTVPAAAQTTQAAMGGSSVAAMGSSSAPAGYAAPSMASPQESAPAQQYGSAPVPGATQSAAPYPMGNDVSPAGVAAASGTMGAAMPSGTGSVNGDTTPFEGAASSVNVAGLFAGLGAVAAFFL